MKSEILRVGFVILLLGLLLPLSVAATSSIDPLLREAETLRTSDPKAFATALVELGKMEDSATPNQKRQIRLLHVYQQMAGGQYDAAIKDALSVYEESSEAPLKFRAALLVANGAAITREFSLGLRYLESALAIQDQVNDAGARELGSLTAAILYNQYGQFALGQHFAERLLAQDSSPRSKCFAQQLRVEALFGLGVPPGDEKEINAAISQCVTAREPIASNLLRGYLARYWVSKGKTAQAIELLEAHLSEVEATGYPRLIGEINGLLAEYRLSVGDLSGAEDHAHRALAKGGKDAYSLPLVTAHKVLYEAALRRGNLATALDEYRQYAEADKARLDEVKAREFAFQLSRHELQQKNQSIELLQRQNDVLKLQQEIAKKSALNTRLGMAMLLLMLGVGGYWAYKVKRVQMMFRRLAQVDSLTEISNRGHFREQAEAQLARCAGSGREAALVLLDLDNFKRINDRHGHATGDWVLKQVAAACRNACREGDLFGRLGGEEFAILSGGADLAAAQRIAQECREQLARIDTSSIEHAPAITASFGCATTKLCGHAFENLFMHADRAMYRAKAEGRDRVCTYEDNPAVPLRAPAIA
ncbi:MULTISPECIES: GGDEF domain-containing protein [unclassified Lysobacter]|uniref:sensor domain-containing diguanylate cyclase n=1 Tax=unclassified Lysobacter TaxID=2635362 RepID=UPI001F561F2A|nr:MULTISPECIES: GGDEF domain-containing protein [unclassified Lysobacter]